MTVRGGVLAFGNLRSEADILVRAKTLDPPPWLLVFFSFHERVGHLSISSNAFYKMQQALLKYQ